MKKLVAIGELLIDFVPQQSGCALADVTGFDRVAGGAPANVAMAVACLGGHASMISQVGTEAFGDYLVANLQAHGVETAGVFRTDKANTALAFVALDKNGDRQFSFYRKPSADLFLNEDQIDPVLLRDAGVLHFCSVDLVDAPVRQAHRRAIQIARENGAIVSFDPNVRLPLWPDAASCQAAIRQFLPLADIVKLSEEEVEFVTGISDREAAAKALLERLPQQQADTALVYMGHGTEHYANAVYALLEYVLHDLGRRDIHIGTVEGYPGFDEVCRRLEETQGVKNVVLLPLMVVAGDHANNDLAGDEEDSWRSMLVKRGYDVRCILEGLGENPAIRAIFVRHAKEAAGE